jgi:DNA-binding response OmpR family regulator
MARLSVSDLPVTGETADRPPGIRILAVEDEFLLATVLAEDLEAAGYAVIGPFGRIEVAREAARHEAFDLAILDINLGGTMVYPLADELGERAIPFLFLTGYGGIDLPPRFADVPRIAKPYDCRVLSREIERCIRDSAGKAAANWP